MISHSHVGEHRKHDTALRHKIRNLRAKVRLLLPLELCCKDQKRAKNLVKMGQHRRAEHALHNHLWNHPLRTSQQLYVPVHPQHVQKHLFDKLSQSEIQQIKEDKLYYVGQEFLEEFDEFLKVKQHRKLKLHSDLKRPLIMMDSVPNLFHHNSQSVRDEFEFEPTHKEEKKIKNMLKMEEIRSKRKQIENHDLTKRAYMKLKNLEKQEKHSKNYMRINDEKMENLRQKGQMTKLKTSQSVRRRHNCEQLGEIYDLAQKLRKVCLQKNSSSKFLLRS